MVRTTLMPKGLWSILTLRGTGGIGEDKRTWSAAGTAWASSTPRARCGAPTTRRAPPSSVPSASTASATPARSTRRPSGAMPRLRLQEELQTLTHSKDRLGDILIRMKRLTIPQLLETLVEQRAPARSWASCSSSRASSRPTTSSRRSRRRACTPWPTRKGVAYAARPVWEQSSPEADPAVHPVARRAARRLGRPHRAQGRRSLHQVPDRRLLLPRRPDPEGLPGEADGEDLRVVRARPAAQRASRRPAA